MSENPKVTVLMPVYNGEKYLREAIESILNQTYKDFEFLIINDGSTDGTVEIIESYDDSRIRLVHNEKNLKLVATLNKGLQLASGEFIARMDGDDISLPERLEKQVAFMDANPVVGICGTWVKTIGDIQGNVWMHPTDADIVRCRLLFESVLAHPSVMMRLSLLNKFRLRYSNDYPPHGEDFHLWQQASERFPVVNIGEVLVLYRVTKNSLSRSNTNNVFTMLERIHTDAIVRLGFSPVSTELAIHIRLGFRDFESTKEFVGATKKWLLKLHDANGKVNLYPTSAFDQVLGERWYMVCAMASGLGMWVWETFWQSPLSDAAGLNVLQRIKFMLKCGMKYDAT